MNDNDEVVDDVEDRKIRQLAEADEASASYEEADASVPSEDERVIISEDERVPDAEPEPEPDPSGPGRGSP